MRKLNPNILPSNTIVKAFLLLTLMISILGCGEASVVDTTLDKSENIDRYQKNDISMKSITEEVNTSNNNTNSLDSTTKDKDPIKTEQSISIEPDNYAKQLEIKEVVLENNLSLVFLYSDYWLGCQRAKPIVDQLEIELDPDIDIKRIDILTEYGKEFSNEYSLSTPGFILLNDSNTELLRFTGVPNKSQFTERLKEYI